MVKICITRSNKQIPSTMATQHPDNASKAYWHECPPSSHNCEYISTAEEIEECYRSFADIGCEEYLWDWEGKFVDEAVIDRLFTSYLEYFKEQQLGRDKFLTFRIPNIWEEDTSRVARAFMAILTANEEAYRFHLNAPPIFEVILPQTDEASKLISMQDKFQKTAKHYCEIFEKDCSMEHLAKSSPVIYGEQELADIRKINKIFSGFYRNSVEAIASFIIDVASLLPAHRERISFSGDKGYGRLIGKEKRRFPRAVKFTGAFYSLGIPPEFIGTGRGIRELTENRKIQTLERFFPDIRDNLIAVGNYLNKNNLEILSAEIEGFHQIKEDVQIIEDYLGKKLGPHNEEGSRHGEETERIVGLILEKENPQKNILNAAKIRKSLG